MAEGRLWTRMGRWFKRDSAELPPVGRDGFLEGVPEAGENEERAVNDGPKLSKIQMREQVLEKLQEGHLKVISLMESMQTHMESQDRRGEAMAGALDHIATNLSQLAGSAGRQTETLGAIAGHLQTSSDRTHRLEEALARFPELADAQRTTLASLGEQLDAGRQTDERISDSLETVRGVLGALDKSTATSTLVLRSLGESSERQQELVGELIVTQRKWLTRLVVVSLVAALGAVALAVIALVR
ncbi:MAG: hypothetical protein GY842_04825 [bacterium]|nr:hypothetical protein [bacterium]